MFSGAVCRADFLYPDEVTLNYTLPGVDSAAISCYTYPMSQSTRKGPIHTNLNLNYNIFTASFPATHRRYCPKGKRRQRHAGIRRMRMGWSRLREGAVARLLSWLSRWRGARIFDSTVRGPAFGRTWKPKGFPTLFRSTMRCIASLRSA